MLNTFTIIIKDAVIQAYVGVYEVEKLNKQPILVNIKIELPEANFENENLETTVNYELVWQMVEELFSKKWLLLESAAKQLAENIKAKYGEHLALSITLMKTNNIIKNFNGSVGVTFSTLLETSL